MLRIENGWSLLLCVENKAVTVVQQNYGRSTEQEKKFARFAERLPPIIGPLSPDMAKDIKSN
jgi:hypothetical protein